MHPIIYDAAVSIDGYISGPGADISRFAQEGPVVEDYLARLSTYAVAIMGKATYEFGYRFGMKPGENPYKHMETLVFSKTLQLPESSAVSVRKTGDATFFRDLKRSAPGPVYLCGGGAFAGSLLSMGMIDIVRLKRAPAVLGGGVHLFGGNTASPQMQHVSTKHYQDGYLLQEFAVRKRS